MPADKKAIISRLQKEILEHEGYSPAPSGAKELIGLGPVEAAFPNGVFPVGTMHEVVCASVEQAAAAGGFISGILSVLMQNGGACLWVTLSKNVFPVALKAFGIEPDRVIFVYLAKDKDVLWVLEEALKCTGLTAVVGELREMDFNQSRRFQLAVERSRVTGFILRNPAVKTGSTACAGRWHIKQLPSGQVDNLPGIGLPRWHVELLRVRNGRPGKWVIEWNAGKFAAVEERLAAQPERLVG